MANHKDSPAVSTAKQFDAGDLDRRGIYNDHRAAAIAVGGMGMALGMWVGNGDYAYFSAEARDQAGRQALEALDAALAEMHEVRDRLAAAVEQDAPKVERDDEAQGPYFSWGVSSPEVYTVPIGSRYTADFTQARVPGSELVVRLEGDTEWLRLSDGVPVQVREV